MESTVPENTVITPAEKPTKPSRTPAQAEATKKMLQALQEKRRSDWEIKKKEVLSKYGDKIKKVVNEEPVTKPTVTPTSDVQPTNKVVEPLQSSTSVQPDLSTLKNEIRDELLQTLGLHKKAKTRSKPKKTVVVEESDDSSEEEQVVVIKKPKKKAVEAPREPVNHYAMLENMFVRQRR